VRYADSLVTIEGEHGTPEMVDLALEFEKPVLPLPFTGGRSEKQWHEHKDVIAKRLRIDEETVGAWKLLLTLGTSERLPSWSKTL
jgi:hypothetical protein